MDASTLVLAVLVVVLVAYMSMNGNPLKNPSFTARKKVALIEPAIAQEEKLGGRQMLGGSKLGIDCKNVALDSPDFARCATTLGAARSTFPRRPANSSRPVNFEEELGARAGRLRGEAFPFTEKSGPINGGLPQNSNVHTNLQEKIKSAVTGGGVPLRKAFLGAAVSPGSREREMATQKLRNVNEVSSYVGGNLNLLNPYS